jgi:GT2 family glycosyltransferase
LVLRSNDGPGVTRIDSAGDTYHLGGFAQKRASGMPLCELPIQPGPVFGASASSAFYRRATLVKVGLFSESFGSYFEDVDVSFRLRHAGGEVVFAPQSRVWHCVHGSYGRPNRRLLEQQSLNEERVFWRNMPARLLARAIPIHIAVLAAKSWRRWCEGSLAPFVFGRLRAIAELRSLWRQRRAIAEFAGKSPHLPLESNWRIAARRI